MELQKPENSRGCRVCLRFSYGSIHIFFLMWQLPIFTSRIWYVNLSLRKCDICSKVFQLSCLNLSGCLNFQFIFASFSNSLKYFQELLANYKHPSSSMHMVFITCSTIFGIWSFSIQHFIDVMCYSW